MAWDRKKRVSRRWEAIRSKQQRKAGHEKGLTGAQLDAAVMAIAMAEPSIVKFETAGAS